MCIKAEYDDGSVFEGDVAIYQEKTEKPVLTIETDENGVACFPSPATAHMKIVLDDGFGHGKVMVIKTEEGKASADPPPHQPLSPLPKLLTGIGLIWGTAGTVFYLLARKKLRGKDAHP